MKRERGELETALRATVVHGGGIKWHVQRCGRGPSLLLLHGTGASADSFSALMPLLAEHFSVIAPDLPGHARTTVPGRFTSDLPSFAAALDGLLSTLEAKPQIVMGHSAGAAVLMRMILDEMIAPSLMVGLAAALVPFQGVASLMFPAAARALAKTSLAPSLIALNATGVAVERVIRGTGSTLDSSALGRYQQLMRQPSHIAGVLSMLSRWNPGATFAELDRLRTPLVLIAGENDRAVPLEQTRQILGRVPHAHLHVVPHAGHLVHEERPAEVLAILLNEIRRQAPLEPRQPSQEI